MVYNNGFINRRIKGTEVKQPLSWQQKKTNIAGNSFGDVFTKALENETAVKFSKHAIQRMQTRNIELSENQLKRLEGAMGKAQVKGVKDSLVLMDEMAMVVSVRNRTVVTVVDKNEMKENVFTNIDGAIIT